jgi:hypothetical protein
MKAKYEVLEVFPGVEPAVVVNGIDCLKLFYPTGVFNRKRAVNVQAFAIERVAAENFVAGRPHLRALAVFKFHQSDSFSIGSV